VDAVGQTKSYGETRRGDRRFHYNFFVSANLISVISVAVY